MLVGHSAVANRKPKSPQWMRLTCNMRTCACVWYVPGAVCDAVACGHRYGRYTCNGIHYLNDVLLRCGQAVYLKLALINHSCRPNCFVTFESGTLQGLWMRLCASH